MSVAGVFGVPPFEDEINHIEQLIITEYDTIKGIYFEEMPLSKFLKNIDKNKNNKYNIEYDNENKIFIIIYKGKSYSLKFDDITMTNYELGNYNSITLKKLNELVNIFNERERINNIIKNGKKGKMDFTKEEKDIYLNYLKQESKKNILSIIKRCFIQLGLISLSTYLSILLGSIDISIGSNIFNIIIVWMSITFMVETLNYIITDMCIHDGYIKPINEIIKQIKLNKHKIKQLEKNIVLQNTKSNNIQEFDKTLENPIKDDLNNFTSYIMKEFSMLLNRINYLNSNNKNELLNKVQLLMDEYINRYKNIIYANKNNELTLDKDDLEKLKLDITKKISDIESLIVDVREKDIKFEQILKEKEILDAKIQESYEEKKLTLTR